MVALDKRDIRWQSSFRVLLAHGNQLNVIDLLQQVLGIHLRRDTLCLQPLSVMIGWRFRGRGKSSMFDNTVSKRSGNPRLKNRAAGVVPSAARPSKFCSTVHTLERRLGKPR